AQTACSLPDSSQPFVAFPPSRPRVRFPPGALHRLADDFLVSARPGVGNLSRAASSTTERFTMHLSPKLPRTPQRPGLTLIELIVVMMILIALAGLLIPMLPGMLTRAHTSTCSTNIGECDK